MNGAIAIVVFTGTPAINGGANIAEVRLIANNPAINGGSNIAEVRLVANNPGINGGAIILVAVDVERSFAVGHNIPWLVPRYDSASAVASPHLTSRQRGEGCISPGIYAGVRGLAEGQPHRSLG